jgi:hypothetical protein
MLKVFKTIYEHLIKNHRNYLWAFFSFVILSLLWDWMYTMVKLIALIIASAGILYLTLTSDKTTQVTSYLAKQKILSFVIACIIVGLLEGVAYRDNLINFLSKAPVQNLIITEDFNPAGWQEKNVRLLEFSVARDNLETIEITTDTDNVTPSHIWMWFDKPHMVFQTTNSIPLQGNKGDFLYSAQVASSPLTFAVIGTYISTQKSLYIELGSNTPFEVRKIIYGGKHFHIEGTAWVLDNP